MPEEPEAQAEHEQDTAAQEPPHDAPEADAVDTAKFDEAAAKEKIRKVNSEAANLRKRIKELEPLARAAKEAEDAKKSESERLTAALEAERARIAALTERTVRAEVRGLAAEKFADPEDAAAFLDLAAYVSEDGDIDAAQIKTDLADLLKRKPHLAKAADPRRPAPDRSQGSSGNGRTKSDPAAEFAAFMGQKLAGR
jgi:chromosome segregation ATPase